MSLGGHLRRVPLRENNCNTKQLSGRFSGSHPASRLLPIFSDSGTFAFRICPQQRTSDAHSGATTTDFHRVPVCLFGPKSGQTAKIFTTSQRAITLYTFYKRHFHIASKKFKLLKTGLMRFPITSFISHSLASSQREEFFSHKLTAAAAFLHYSAIRFAH
jgi:hypothetical protein